MSNQTFWKGILAACVTLVTLIASASCGKDELVRSRPPFEVVDGTPAVDPGLPSIDDRTPTVNPDDFANNAPVQVDVFFQKTVRKVDILWVVDNSCSMAQEQQSLATSFTAFITDLTSADPPVDYHLGVITTDAAAERGQLRPLATDATKSYIACNENGGTGCNVVDEALAFEQTIAVGTAGGAIEKGLLAAHLALSEPMKSTLNAGFLRDDAALYVVIVSDEGDASCDPILDVPGGSDLTSCRFTPFCRCGDTTTGFGAAEYYTRFFEGLKGYGNEDLVAVAAIVALDQRNFQDSDTGNLYSGCTNSATGSVGLYAPRYIEVANDTGGITTSICQADFSGALSALGFAVSGQRRDFPLSRRTIDPNVSEPTVTIQSDPSDPTTKVLVPRSATDGWDYVLCENTNFLNAIRFSGSYVPLPRSRVEVTYQVDVGSGRSC